MARRDTPLGPEEFQALAGVSRETLDKLRLYADLLVKWQRSLNLVGAASLDDLWCRHMLDSAQLHRYIPSACERLVDLGSGAGFPGLVLAIMGVAGVELVDSDQKKATFLREVIRATGTVARVHVARAEAMPAEPADVVTARALAPLDRLIPLAYRFMGPSTVALIPKGVEVERELTAAARDWHMWYTRRTSLSDGRATILIINRLWRERRN
jgi:16S rRNA (guanine527-N7)-methyltransferase